MLDVVSFLWLNVIGALVVVGICLADLFEACASVTSPWPPSLAHRAMLKGEFTARSCFASVTFPWPPSLAHSAMLKGDLRRDIASRV